MATDLKIVDVMPREGFLGSVIDLGNGPAKRTLGFLPDQGFMDRAEKGTLLAAVDDEELLGYVLYDLPGNDVKIVHLCVADQARRRGVARLLTDEVARRHSDRQRIVLRCRHDYEATAVWEALGFLPVASIPGRSQAGHLLTVWVRDFGHPTLFDLVETQRSLLALDHNVFLDLHMDPEMRPEGAESRHLLDDWIDEYAELCVTDEVFYEIHALRDQEQRRSEQQWASQYRKLSGSGEGWVGLAKVVANCAPRAGDADHRHVARAIEGGADFFVSRDRALIQAAEQIETTLGIVVLPPEALIVRLDRMRSDDPYKPIALKGTDLRQVSPSEDLHNEMLSSLLNHGAGEKRASLGSLLRPALADRNHEVQIVQDRDGKILGGFSRRAGSEVLEVPLIRVVPRSSGAYVIARQLVFEQRQYAADLGLSAVRISDQFVSRDIRSVLELEHFEESGEQWVCPVKTGILDAGQIPELNPISSEKASDFEDRQWPVKIRGAGVPTFLVPIRVAFAEELFDLGLAGQSLLPRQLGLGLSREHVYYRKTRNARGIGPGARVFWYVTGDSPVHSRGSLRGISQVAEVVVGRPRTLFARFERFGVYSAEQVSSLADRNGQVMAIRFTNTEILESPVGLDELQKLWAGEGMNFSAPQSPTAISEHMFCLLYERSSAYAG